MKVQNLHWTSWPPLSDTYKEDIQQKRWNQDRLHAFLRINISG
jgi:hypothetical protein